MMEPNFQGKLGYKDGGERVYVSKSYRTDGREQNEKLASGRGSY